MTGRRRADRTGRVRGLLVAGWVVIAAGCSVAAPGSPVPESLEPLPSELVASDDPTIAPEPSSTPPAVSLAPTPGPLPEGLDDRLWYTTLADGGYVVGTLAGAERITLPAGDVPFAIGPDVIATARPHPDGSQRTIIGFVSFTRAVAEPVTVPFVVTSGAFVGSELIITGGTVDKIDTGVLAIDIATGATRYLIDPGPWPPGWEEASQGMRASPSGETVAVSSCLVDQCLVRVLRQPFGPPQPAFEIKGYLRVMSDDVVLYGPDPPTGVSGTDLDSGATLWTLPEAEEYPFSYVADETTLVQSRRVWRNEAYYFEIVLVDLPTGAQQVLLSTADLDGYTLWSGLSNDRFAVLGRGGRLQKAGSLDSLATVDLLDLTTGELRTGAIAFGLHP